MGIPWGQIFTIAAGVTLAVVVLGIIGKAAG